MQTKRSHAVHVCTRIFSLLPRRHGSVTLVDVRAANRAGCKQLAERSEKVADDGTKENGARGRVGKRRKLREGTTEIKIKMDNGVNSDRSQHISSDKKLRKDRMLFLGQFEINFSAAEINICRQTYRAPLVGRNSTRSHR